MFLNISDAQHEIGWVQLKQILDNVFQKGWYDFSSHIKIFDNAFSELSKYEAVRNNIKSVESFQGITNFIT